ncbi:MAG: adenylate/guanylate cyclase domain-containing protein [Stellaceae bacterium]
MSSGQRKLAAILAADVAGYSRLAGADEERTLARLRALRSDLIDPTISVHKGRVFKRTGDGILIEFRSVVDAVRCAVEVQAAMIERNAGLSIARRIEFRIGIHLGDVVEESDGDLLGDGINVAARLETIADPGGICLSEDAWRQVRDKVAAGFLDLGEKRLKNIARPLRVYAHRIEPAQAHSPPSAVEPEKQSPPRLSMVVLPFANIGGDPEQEYFADGVTDSLTTDLARIAGSFVIARNTAFAFKGKSFDVKRIGRELNVRYVLEGSVQRGGDRLRINVQLVDAANGAHLWAERFDKTPGDLFDMQDEIVARVALQVDAELIEAEARRAEKSPQPDSIDLYFQGVACYQRGVAPESMAQARAYLDRAVLLDPKNYDAMVWRASIDSLIAGPLYAADRAERLAEAEVGVIKVLSVLPNHAFAHYVLGVVLCWSNRVAEGIAEFERALAINPNLAIARAYIGIAKLFHGHGGETESHIQQALRLSPRDTFAYAWMYTIGFAKLALGAATDAITWLRHALEANRNYPMTHFVLAAALVRVGRPTEARAAVRAGLEIDPAFSLARFRTGAPSDNPTYLALRERIIESMHDAGVPE